jgi:hypothetical protein
MQTYAAPIDRDAALLRAWNLAMDDEGWSDAVREEAESLLPILLEAGYVWVDDAAGTWASTDIGIARAEELERNSDLHPGD